MRLKSPIVVNFAGRLCGRALRLLFATLKKTIRGDAAVMPYGDEDLRPDRYLYAAWHDSALLAAFGGPHRRMVALTSRHRDGSFVENMMRTIGVGAVRGSSGRGGSSAARQLLETAETHDIVITPDGPRGPRRVLSRGIVFIASRTGNGIVPTAYACERAWEIEGSWTTQSIPKPFSKVVFLAGDPIYVPRDLDKDELEPYRVKAQTAMDTLQGYAERLLANSTPVELAKAA